VIADVAFDLPALHPFSYLVPEGWRLEVGQRVAAPLRGALRTGVVVALRAGPAEALKPLARVLDPRPVLGPRTLELIAWIAAESLTSFGSTCLALMPPPTAAGPPLADSAAGAPLAALVPPGGPLHPNVVPDPAGAGVPAPSRAPGAGADGRSDVTVLTGPGRGARLLDRLAPGGGLVLTADVESAARWAERLATLGPVARLDSGVSDAERARGWSALQGGDARLGVGTRSALLAPLPVGAVIALVDEHEAAHKPPGPPRLHAREIVLERARRERRAVVLTSATPSVETWWRTDSGLARLEAAAPAAWPAVILADTLGIGRREALTPALSRAIRETLAAGRRVFLAVSRLRSILGCDECGAVLRCAACGIALAYSPARRALACRLCGAAQPVGDTCSACGGRRLTPLGWGAERVEHAVRRRFARARIVRYDPEAAQGRAVERQRAAALGAEVVIGTRGALRLFGLRSLGLVGFIAPDQLLGIPDFRAAERVFALLWAAAERVHPDGRVVVQSRNAGHYAIQAVARADPAIFYKSELKFRAELGYPPFRRLAVVTVDAGRPDESARLAAAVYRALDGTPRLTVYPPLAGRPPRRHRLVVKGHADLPAALDEALGGDGAIVAARTRGIMTIEVDPVEWPS
jgi:primosomal protein N' (replication factor Y)